MSWIRTLLVLLALGLVACNPTTGDDDDTVADDDDTGDDDDSTGDDDDSTGDDDDSVPPLRTTYSLSNGGGTTASSTHQARIVIGAPQPAGATSSSTTNAVIGAAP